MLRLLLVISSFTLICHGYQQDRRVTRETVFDVDAYLEKYGYLPPISKDSEETNPAHSEHTRSHAIRLFQKFAHLQTTGKINKETINKMQQPRCGFPDIIHTHHDPKDPLKFTAGPKWKNKTVTWRIVSYTDKLAENEQRIAIENSFGHWEHASGLTFIETNDTADINILFATGYHGDGLGNAFDGAGGVLAHAFLPEDGRAHFDNDEFWVFHQSDGAEIETVVTHELGHSLGLSHSIVRGALMAPFYQDYTDNFTLHWDDVAGIQYLYGPPEVSTTITQRPEIIITNTTSQLEVATTITPKPEIVNKSMTSLPTNMTTAVTQKPDVIIANTTTELSMVTPPGEPAPFPPEPTVPPRIIDEKLCSSKIDAAIPGERGTLQIFIGPYIYKLYENCNETHECVFRGYPKKIKKVFKKGPKRVKTAAYLPDHRKRTYLFKGRKVWRYTGKKLDKGFPKQMSKKDLPYKPNAAYIQKNQFADYQLYMFGGKYFWELNLYTDGITNGVMKIKTYWDYVPSKPDAMLQTKDGHIYVFKGKYYNKYDHRRVLLEKRRLIARDLLGAECL